MRVIRRSPLSGVLHHREIDVTHEQLNRWEKGELIQNVMPHLSPNDREFIVTGITPEEWTGMFPSSSKQQEAPETETDPETDPETTVSYFDVVGGTSGQTRMKLSELIDWLDNNPGHLIHGLRGHLS